jgi:uncharacterized protein YidB (DUF937 family)
VQFLARLCVCNEKQLVLAEYAGICIFAEVETLHAFLSRHHIRFRQPIGPGQLQGLLGEDRLNELARRAGVPPAIASAALARILPAVVDRMPPQGKVPEAA